jgi:hypothetical protein
MAGSSSRAPGHDRGQLLADHLQRELPGGDLARVAEGDEPDLALAQASRSKLPGPGVSSWIGTQQRRDHQQRRVRVAVADRVEEAVSPPARTRGGASGRG